MYLSETHEKKWQPVLEHPDLPEIKDSYRRAVTSVILENQERAAKEDQAFLNEAAPTNATGSSIANWDPILISLVRRAMPNLIAYDIAGVQPMTGPTGLIFAMRSRYTSQTGNEPCLTKLIQTSLEETLLVHLLMVILQLLTLNHQTTIQVSKR